LFFITKAQRGKKGLLDKSATKEKNLEESQDNHKERTKKKKIKKQQPPPI